MPIIILPIIVSFILVTSLWITTVSLPFPEAYAGIKVIMIFFDVYFNGIYEVYILGNGFYIGLTKSVETI